MSEVRERKIGSLTVRLHRDGCISTGACVKAAPEVLQLDSRQLVSFAEPPAEIDRDQLIDACQFCPVGALEAIDEDGERLAP
ncbi:MAG: ferredoxin [Thermoanaerobaculia bacterium]